jgi:hypothetical protein
MSGTPHPHAFALMPNDEDPLEHLLERALEIVRRRRQPAAPRTLRPAAEETGGGVRSEAGEGGNGVFVKRGDVWFIAYEGREFLLNDLIGLRYLAELLSSPHREIAALDLFLAAHDTPCDAADAKTAMTSACDLGPLLDRRAVAACRSRLRDLDEDLREARNDDDLSRLERLQEEKGAILSRLQECLGLHGASIPRGSPARRAQSSVARAIKRATNRVARQNPLLGRHLDATIRTGISCSYTPDPRLRVSWKTR